MMDGDALLPAVVLTTVLGFFVAAIVIIFLQRKPVSKESEENTGDADEDESNKVDDKALKSQSGTGKLKHEKGKGKGNKEHTVSHPLLITSLKGHTGPVVALDRSSCGKYLASASEDRTVRLWRPKDFSEKDHKYTRANVELDHATSVGFSPDSKAFIVSLASENTVRVFRLNKKKDGPVSGITVSAEVFDFPKEHKGDIIYAGVALNGKFVMTISKDTKMVLWTLKGEVLTTIDTLQVNNSHGAISPCGNFVASSGFTPDVKLWSVEFDKSSIFKQVGQGMTDVKILRSETRPLRGYYDYLLEASKALELKGHSSGVYSFSFSSDSTRVATVSKDGSWRVYDIDVDYKKSQESYLLATGNYTSCFVNSPNIDHAIVALSPDGYCMAIAIGKCIGMFNVFSTEMEELLTDVHNGDITALTWMSSSQELASAGGSDRTVRIWHNPTGARSMIADLKAKLQKAKTDLIRERIQSQIKSARSYLESLGYKE